MKAMLRKDFLYLRRQGRLLPMIFSVYIILIAVQLLSSQKSAAENGIGMISAFCAMTAATLTMNVVGIDEQAKWDGFARSLPVGIPAIVGARYAFTAILAAAGVVVELIFGFAAGGLRPEDFASACAVTFGIPLLVCSFMLPIHYKFGYQKAVAVSMVIIFSVGGVISFLQKKGILQFSDSQLFLLVKLSPVILAAAAALSFFLSCRIYAKKEM